MLLTLLVILGSGREGLFSYEASSGFGWLSGQTCAQQEAELCCLLMADVTPRSMLQLITPLRARADAVHAVTCAAFRPPGSLIIMHHSDRTVEQCE